MLFTDCVFQDILANLDFSKFQSLKPNLLEEVDKMLANDIAKLMAMIPLQDANNRNSDNGDRESNTVKGFYPFYDFIVNNVLTLLLTYNIRVCRWRFCER